MKSTLSENTIIDAIKKVFIDQDKYFFDKHVPEIQHNGKFLGDYFNQLAVEPRENSAPRFYHTFSPYDVISNEAPHRAVVFDSGKLILDIDFDDYVSMRTAAMSIVFLQTVGVNSLDDKKVLLFGAGNIAQQSIRFLKAAYPELVEVACISKSGELDTISDIASKQGLSLVSGDSSKISEYDVIICHTKSDAPVIDSNNTLKDGALVASFISSTDHGELDDVFFDDSTANIVCDWGKTIDGAKEISRSIAAGRLKEGSILFLGDLLKNPSIFDQTKKYTIYRSTGTPLQNLAILQLLADS